MLRRKGGFIVKKIILSCTTCSFIVLFHAEDLARISRSNIYVLFLSFGNKQELSIAFMIKSRLALSRHQFSPFSTVLKRLWAACTFPRVHALALFDQGS